MLRTLNGTRIAFEDSGNGPAVILLHDLPLCREMWWPQLDELARQNYRVIAPDIRGFGESQADHRPLSISLCCRDIIGLMRSLGIGRAVFVGIGAASYIISELQRIYPNRVAAICMISPQTAITDSLTRHRSRDLTARIQAGKRLSVIDCLCKKFLPFSQSVPEVQQLSLQVQRWMEMANPAAITFALNLVSRVESQARPLVPTLLINGPEQEQPEPLSRQSSLTICEQIAGSWPLLNLELPDKFNQCLIGFLDWVSQAKPGHHRLAIAA